MTEISQNVIIVGVDGSEASTDALRWAARQAHLTGATLKVIRAWQLPPQYGFPVDYSDADFDEEARKQTQQAIAEVLGTDPQVHLVTEVIQSPPAPALIDASATADLLVVGSHGRGAFARMLLGSVSLHCVQHAICPVVVVRPRRPPT
ncbi:universal stress protein [Streptosporangium jomthongense]|uniref:Universal stress protein n=1 Tax=Streptosporangium jomthongense TaxID=1193683 RepID=A0ABV8FA98_9ACTN